MKKEALVIKTKWLSNFIVEEICVINMGRNVNIAHNMFRQLEFMMQHRRQ
jgi:hypothetical protein